MKRVIFGCDPVGDCVIWEDGGFMTSSGRLPIALSEELRRSLLDWNARMGAIVSRRDLFSPSELIRLRGDLNLEGESLARRIEAEHDGQVKVRFLKD